MGIIWSSKQTEPAQPDIHSLQQNLATYKRRSDRYLNKLNSCRQTFESLRQLGIPRPPSSTPSNAFFMKNDDTPVKGGKRTRKYRRKATKRVL